MIIDQQLHKSLMEKLCNSDAVMTMDYDAWEVKEM